MLRKKIFTDTDLQIGIFIKLVLNINKLVLNISEIVLNTNFLFCDTIFIATANKKINNKRTKIFSQSAYTTKLYIDIISNQNFAFDRNYFLINFFI